MNKSGVINHAVEVAISASVCTYAYIMWQWLVMLQMSSSGMQLLMKVKACVIVHPGSMQVWFLACEFSAGHSSFICREGLDLED